MFTLCTGKIANLVSCVPQFTNSSDELIWGRNSILKIQFITLCVLQLLKMSGSVLSSVNEKHSFDSSWVKVYSSQPLLL